MTVRRRALSLSRAAMKTGEGATLDLSAQPTRRDNCSTASATRGPNMTESL